MAKLAMTVIMKDYDYLTPLLTGEVAAEEIDLTIDRKRLITEVSEDPKVPAGEYSFSRFLILWSQGVRSFVPIPFFCYRAFRQRCFFVKRGSRLRDLKELSGKRVGTNAWPDTGNTWSRAAMRERGVKIDSIQWWVGAIDEAHPGKGMVGTEPSYVRAVPQGRNLREMLIAGDLDALMVPIPPKGFYEANDQIVRLYPNYREVEREYLHRTGIYPGHHIFLLRRELFEKQPWIALNLYAALDKSRKLWQQKRLDLAELTPWSLADVEETISLLGPDWHTNGFAANRKMIQALCDEELAQGLVKQQLDPASVFADFEKATK
jgi:4,5-dihydroxyphthalate decarboxylase